MDFTGTSGDDTLTGTSGDDLFKVFQGGNDTVSGLTGSDVFNFAGTLTAADTIDGGGGQDTVQIKGDYAAGILFSATTMVNVETLTVGAGFNYTITTDDATVAAGAVFTLNAAALAAPNYVVFNGSNETDGLLHFHGGAGDDTVGMGPNMSADDHFDGGDGNDELLLGGVNTLTFKSVTIHNIETIELVPTFGGSLAFNSGNVLAGQTIEIDGSSVGGAGYYTINAHNLPGNVIFDGGEHDVKVTGGSGNDIFNMGAVFTRDDRLAGGAGNDTLNLNGAYNITLVGGTIAGIDQVNLAGGHNYHLTSADNLVTDETMAVNATGLTATDTLFLDFSSETLGSVILDGGAAPAILKGGQQGDAFDFSVTSQGGFTASDQIDGQGGYDRLYLDGDYTGAHALAFTNTTMVNVEEIDFNGGHSYSLTLSGKNVAVGGSLVADASQLGASDTLTFNAAAVSSTAALQIIGGAGNDTLTGGRGATTFDLSHGGNDTATGQTGDDIFTMGATLNAADTIDGGDGNDTIVLDGATNVTLTDTTFVNVETLRLSAGSNYTIAMAANNVASRESLTVDASALGASNSLHFDGTANEISTYLIIGGAGNDVLVASQLGATFDLSHGGSDQASGIQGFSLFEMGAALDSTDRLDGGTNGGFGTITLNGDYTGAHALTLNSTIIKHIDEIDLGAGHSYDITYASSVPPGDTMFKIDGSTLGASDSLTVNLSAVKTGSITEVTGGAGDDHITSGKNGFIQLYTGGEDTANAQGGSVAMGATFDTGDRLSNVGGIQLAGDYAGAHALTIDSTMLSSAGGTGATLSFAGPGFSYDITVTSASVISKVTGFVAGGSLTFDGSAETTNGFTFTLSASPATLTGGGGADSATDTSNSLFVFHGNGGDDAMAISTFNTSDVLDGGTGNDTLTLNQGQTIAFAAANLTGVENIVVTASSTLTTVDANVAAGQTLSVAIAHSGALTFNGAAETDGSFNLANIHQGGNTLVGGAQADTLNVIDNNTLTGGGGGDLIEVSAHNHIDTIVYNAVSDSTSTGYDTIQGLNFTTDFLKVSAAGTAPSGINAAVTTGALSTASFDTDLAAAIGSGQLAAHHALLFTASSGGLSGHTFLVVDENGTAGYQASADLVIDVTGFAGHLATSSFS